mgnify:CR=1 FL=1|jgi:phage shock protein PspC (stress-responsive transcriptional regulator)
MTKIYRSSRDKKLTGLCGGLAEAMGVDATLLRIVAIVLAVVTSGGFILIYILAAMVVPKEPPYHNPYGRGPGGYGGYGGHPPGGGYWNTHNGAWRNPGYGPGAPGDGSGYGPQPHYQSPPPNPNDLDAMMDDLEKKALRREIEELKAKIRKLEKGE